MENERRLAMAYFGERQFLELMLSSADDPGPLFFCLPEHQLIPKGTQIVRVSHCWELRAFGFLLTHPSFAEVPDGSRPPNLRDEFFSVVPLRREYTPAEKHRLDERTSKLIAVVSRMCNWFDAQPDGLGNIGYEEVDALVTAGREALEYPVSHVEADVVSVDAPGDPVVSLAELEEACRGLDVTWECDAGSIRASMQKAVDQFKANVGMTIDSDTIFVVQARFDWLIERGFIDAEGAPTEASREFIPAGVKKFVALPLEGWDTTSLPGEADLRQKLAGSPDMVTHGEAFCDRHGHSIEPDRVSAPQPKCKRCNDKGYFTIGGDPIQCPNCREAREKVRLEGPKKMQLFFQNPDNLQELQLIAVVDVPDVTFDFVSWVMDIQSQAISRLPAGWIWLVCNEHAKEYVHQPNFNGESKRMWLFREDQAKLWRLFGIDRGRVLAPWITMPVSALTGQFLVPTDDQIVRCKNDRMGRLIPDEASVPQVSACEEAEPKLE